MISLPYTMSQFARRNSRRNYHSVVSTNIRKFSFSLIPATMTDITRNLFRSSEIHLARESYGSQLSRLEVIAEASRLNIVTAIYIKPAESIVFPAARLSRSVSFHFRDLCSPHGLKLVEYAYIYVDDHVTEKQ